MQPGERSAWLTVAACSSFESTPPIPPHLPPPKPEEFSWDSGDCKVFLVQCGLHFELQAAAYPTEHSKVTFVLSQLVGRAEPQVNLLFLLSTFLPRALLSKYSSTRLLGGRWLLDLTKDFGSIIALAIKIDKRFLERERSQEALNSKLASFQTDPTSSVWPPFCRGATLMQLGRTRLSLEEQQHRLREGSCIYWLRAMSLLDVQLKTRLISNPEGPGEANLSICKSLLWSAQENTQVFLCIQKLFYVVGVSVWC